MSPPIAPPASGSPGPTSTWGSTSGRPASTCAPTRSTCATSTATTHERVSSCSFCAFGSGRRSRTRESPPRRRPPRLKAVGAPAARASLGSVPDPHLTHRLFGRAPDFVGWDLTHPEISSLREERPDRFEHVSLESGQVVRRLTLDQTRTLSRARRLDRHESLTTSQTPFMISIGLRSDGQSQPATVASC